MQNLLEYTCDFMQKSGCWGCGFMYGRHQNAGKKNLRWTFTMEKKSRETAIEMLKDGEPLTKIMKYSKLDKEAILLLAKENGLEVIDV